MARENQGLQYALIAFVLLTIVLGVTTFVFFRLYQQTSVKEEANGKEATRQANAARDAVGIAEELKKMMGFAPSDTIKTVQDEFAKDMTRFAADTPEDARFYRLSLAHLSKAYQELNRLYEEQVKTTKDLGEQITALNAVTDRRVAPFEEAVDKTNQEKQAEMVRFENDRKRITGQMDQLDQDLKQTRTKYDGQVGEMKGQLASFEKENRDLSDALEKRKRIINTITDESPNAFQGEITLVNQENGVVWINLGRDDALRPQTNFGIYPAGILNMTETTDLKAKIEVTKILSAHLAEARILEDRISDPILPGDKIFTAVWNVGEKRRFALAGIFDLDNNGQSDLDLLHTLIESNGGVIDAKKDASGKREGALNVNTRYLVIGAVPGATATPEEIKDFQEMQQAADKLKVDTITISQFLDRMGWKHQLQVLPFGRGMDRPFAVRPDGVPRVSGNKISDVFKPRKPPRSNGGSTF